MERHSGIVDPDALAAAAIIQRDEIEHYELALVIHKMQLEEVERAIQEEKDARMAWSIASANIVDADAIEAARQEDEEEADIEDDEDRILMEYQARPATNDLRTLSKLAGEYMSPEAGKVLFAKHQKGVKQVSTSDQQVVTAPAPKHDCVICGDTKEYYEVMDMSCGHAYCRGCVRDLFMASFKDESLFPPRCCRQPLMLENIDIFLTREIRDTFTEKEVEFSVKKRIYCHNNTCSAFIAPAYYDLDEGCARCQKCSGLTCLTCKQEHHDGVDCPVNQEQRDVLDLSQQAGWQRCRQCETMVELHTGCYHITCTCGHEFCYLCAASPWKSCQCPEWDERHLLDQANEIVARGNPNADVDWDELVQQATDWLVANHGCQHRHLEGFTGRSQCDACRGLFNCLIYRCQQCHYQFCWRCRFNRAR